MLKHVPNFFRNMNTSRYCDVVGYLSLAPEFCVPRFDMIDLPQSGMFDFRSHTTFAQYRKIEKFSTYLLQKDESSSTPKNIVKKFLVFGYLEERNWNLTELVLEIHKNE